MATPLFPILQKIADDEWIKLDREQITPWAFFNTPAGINVPRFGGGSIVMNGIEFWGSAVDVFWCRYIEPFLEDITLRTFERARKLALDRKLDVITVIQEAAGLMVTIARKAFRRMAEIDRRLRGKGYPSTVPARNIDIELATVETFIQKHLRAELAMAHKGKWVRIEQNYQSYPAAWWLVGIAISIGLGLLAM